MQWFIYYYSIMRLTPKPGYFLSGITILLVTLLISFFLLEGIFRLFLEKPETVVFRSASPPPASPALKQQLSTVEGVPDSALYLITENGVRLRPNTSLTIENHRLSHRSILIETNAFGFRYGELKEKTAEDFRILVLGDSITFGDFVPYEDTYPFVIEDSLKSQNLSKNIQVINAGIGNTGIKNYFSILMETGASVKPDIVLVGLYLNDAGESYPFTLNVSAYPEWTQKSYLLHFILRRFNILNAQRRFASAEKETGRSKQLQQFLAEHPITPADDRNNENSYFNGVIADAFMDWGYAWSDECWVKISEYAKLIKQAAESTKAELFIVLFPVRQQVEAKILRDEPQQHFKRIMEETGVKHLDLLPALREKFQNDAFSAYYDHCHFKPEGNRFVGKEVAEFLAKSEN